MLVFPICAPGEAEKPVGVLQIINKIGGAFDSADEELLAAFSNKAAPLISAHPMYYKHEEEQSTEAEALSGTSPSPKVRHGYSRCCAVAACAYRQGRGTHDSAIGFGCCRAFTGRLSTQPCCCTCRLARRLGLGDHLWKWCRKKTRRRKKRKTKTTSSKTSLVLNM